MAIRHSQERVVRTFNLDRVSDGLNLQNNPAGIHLFKGNNKNTRTMCSLFRIINKDTRMTSFGVFIVKFEHISHLLPVLSLLILNKCPLGIH